MIGRRAIVLRAGAVIVLIASTVALSVGAGADRARVAAERDTVLAATCVSALERAGRADEALVERPDLATADSYASERQSRQHDGRRPSSVGIFRDRCQPVARADQLSVLVNVAA